MVKPLNGQTSEAAHCFPTLKRQCAAAYIEARVDVRAGLEESARRRHAPADGGLHERFEPALVLRRHWGEWGVDMFNKIG
jgi:hypothetical protein